MPFVLVFLCACSTPEAGDRVPLIFDTDIGSDIDDAYALCVAARNPKLDLRLVTTAYGKADVRSQIARKLLDLMGRKDVPVATGRSDSTYWGGHEGKGLIAEGETVYGVSGKPAPSLMVDVLRASKRKVVICSVGGVTNVAAALQMAPDVRDKIERVVIMGGTVRPIVIDGVEIIARAETNLHHDPESSAFVLRSGVSITLVPADVTYLTKLFNDDFERVKTSGRGWARAIVRMNRIWEPRMKKAMANMGVKTYYDDGVAMLHDPLAVALLVDPSLAEIESTKILVELGPKSILTFANPDGDVRIDVVTKTDLKRLSRFVTDHVVR